MKCEVRFEVIFEVIFEFKSSTCLYKINVFVKIGIFPYDSLGVVKSLNLKFIHRILHWPLSV